MSHSSSSKHAIHTAVGGKLLSESHTEIKGHSSLLIILHNHLSFNIIQSFFIKVGDPKADGFVVTKLFLKAGLMAAFVLDCL